MIALYIIGGLIALIIILALLTGKAWSFEKSIHINATPGEVWQHVNRFSELNRWSPYVGLDPNMKQQLTGTDGTVGATYAWDSESKKVGAGSQTIEEIVENQRIASKLKFIRPFSGVADTQLRLAAEDGGTKVSWHISSETPYPMNIIKLFGVIEKNMDRDFGRGLDKLKVLCES